MKTALILIMLAALAFNVNPHTNITVYPNGYARINIMENVTEFVPVNITLMGVPQGLTVSYSNGSPAYYSYSNGVVKILPDVNGTINVNYYTYTIIFKNNISWFINFTTPYYTIVQLPYGASLVYINGVPSSVKAVNGTLYISLPAGKWDIGYIMPPPATKSSPQVSLSFSEAPLIYVASAVVILLLAVTVIFAYSKRHKETDVERSLDHQILEFIKKKGGTAKESEIRESLVLPKTTAWRAIKRLERQGLVKVEKKGKENYVTLT
ncbi:MAG: helix-turn-helix transcriptional regulator [Nitrososphaeria archaeon]|jgi:uncharacterized membrane protein